MALMGLLNRERTRIGGEAIFGGRNLLTPPAARCEISVARTSR